MLGSEQLCQEAGPWVWGEALSLRTCEVLGAVTPEDPGVSKMGKGCRDGQWLA